MWKWLLVCILSFVMLAIPSLILADSSAYVVVTATGYVCSAPGGLTLTYISDYEVGLSWIKGAGAENTIIRKVVGRLPTSRTDGTLVYYGNGTSCSDFSVNLDTTDAPVYYRAWSEKAGGIWEGIGISDFIAGGNMLLIGLIVLCGIVSFLAIRNRFMLLKLMAGAGWVAMFVYWMYSPPAAIVKGSPPHIAIMLVFAGMAIAIPLVGLGREVSTQQDWRTGLSVETSESFRFKLPDWMKSSESTEKVKRMQSVEEYRERMHRALNPKKEKER